MHIETKKIEYKGTRPAPRYNFSLVHDAVRNRLVLFGGAGEKFYSDLWLLNLPSGDLWNHNEPLEWENVEVDYEPKKRSDQSTLHDRIKDRMMVFGGIKRRDLWALDLKELTWTMLYSDDSTASLASHCSVFDSKANRILTYGGIGSFPELFAFQFKSGEIFYEPIQLEESPGRLSVHTAHYDRRSHSVFVFGGYKGNLQYLNDVMRLRLKESPHVWEGCKLTDNRKLCPDPRAGHSSIIDEVNRRMLVYAGKDTNFVFDDFWLFHWKDDKYKWTKLGVEGESPGNRHGHSLLKDLNRDYMYCFGGNGEDGQPLNDLWLIRLAEV